MTKTVAPLSPGTVAAFYATKQWKVLRASIVKRDGYRCTVCGAGVKGKGKARVDHIVEAKKRPDLFFDARNLRTLCTSCDAKRHFEKGNQGNARPRPEIGADGFPIDSDGDLWRDKQALNSPCKGRTGDAARVNVSPALVSRKRRPAGWQSITRPIRSRKVATCQDPLRLFQ